MIVTDNLFGDMLSDVAAMLTGSLGMLPSASLGDPNPKTGKRKAMYEPVHGSAPDIAGKGLANPIAMIASFGMALRYSFDAGVAADRLDAAIAAVLAAGYRTADIKSDGSTSSRRPRWATRSWRRWRRPRADSVLDDSSAANDGGGSGRLRAGRPKALLSNRPGRPRPQGVGDRLQGESLDVSRLGYRRGGLLAGPFALEERADRVAT